MARSVPPGAEHRALRWYESEAGKYALAWFLWGSLLFLLAALMKEWQAVMEGRWNVLWQQLFISLGTALFIGGGIGTLFAMKTRDALKAVVSEALFEVLMHDPVLLREMFDEQHRKKMIENAIVSILNSGRGAALYRASVDPYLRRAAVGYRTSFTYVVTVSDLVAPRVIAGVNLEPEKYWHFVESLQFTKVYEDIPREVWAACCFAEEELNIWRADEKCVYRWILRLDEDHAEQVRGAVHTNSEDLSKICQVEVAVENGLPEILRPVRRDGYPGLAFKVPIPERAQTTRQPKEIRDLSFRFTVTTVRHKGKRFFTAYSFDPTFKPGIQFTYPAKAITKDITNVATAKFLTPRTARVREDRVFVQSRIARVAVDDEWVFPTSGVVITWD